MKKSYNKPEIAFESFALCSSIAAGCGVHVDGANAGACGITFGGETIFMTGIAGCATQVETDDGLYNGLCYHVPTASSALFNS